MLEITDNLYFQVDNAQMHVGLFFDNYFDFLSVETDINKSRLNLINLEESEAIKRHIPATWLTICLNHFEFDVIWKVFQLLMMLNFQFLYNFHDFRVFAFGYRVQNEKPEITENLFFFRFIKFKWMWLFFHHYFNFLSVKTDTHKNGPSLIKPKGQKTFKPKYLLYGWMILSLMSFEQHFNCFWNYVLILQYYGVFVEFP